MGDACRRRDIGASDACALKNSSIYQRWWLTDFLIAVAAAIASVSFAMVPLSVAAFAQTVSEPPDFEYVSRESSHEATVVEGNTIWEETTAAQGISTGDEQYGDPLSGETLVDTGGVAPWVVGGVVAFFAIVGLMVLSSGLVIRGTRASRELRGNRRGGSHHDR